MSFFGNVGEVTIEGSRISWIMKDFFNFPNDIDTHIGSRYFYVKQKIFYFVLHPNGTSDSKYPGWMKLALNGSSGGETWQVQLGIRAVSGENVHISCAQQLDFYKDKFFVDRFILKELVIQQKDRLVPNGTLCIVAEIQDLEVPAVPKTTSGLEVPKNEKKHSLADAYTRPETQFEEYEKKHSLPDAYTLLEEQFEVPKNEKKHSLVEACTQTEKDFDLKDLAHDFKDLLMTGNGSDFTIKLNDLEYNVHRTVLIARSPVFLAMMTHDTKEKATGVAILEDLEPEVFSLFLHYLYTGSVETLARENMLKLYVTADRYQVMKLKDVCVDYIGNNIFVDNFCDVMTLPLQHSEKSLITSATKFFLKNSLQIVLTSKWQTFLSENATAGNELIIKMLQRNHGSA